MQLTTAHDMSFQDLTNICLPFIAQAEVERYFAGGLQYNEINNLDKFLSNTNARVSRDKLTNLLSKINDAEVFLVNSSTKISLSDSLVSLRTNLEIEQDRKGLNVEHWQVHPQLRGIAKFNAELLIQRLTYHERVYGVSCRIKDKQAQIQRWQELRNSLSQRKSLKELSGQIDEAVPVNRS